MGEVTTFESRVASALGRLAQTCETYLVAVSGGPDSVSLLLAMVRLGFAKGDRLRVAHFDHQLRPESGDDAEFVAKLAERYSVPFHLGRPDPASDLREGPSLERAARDARYRFLCQIAEQVGAAVVLTAHTADDQVETVLHRLVRGTGLGGLAGIPEARSLTPALRVLRPMLSLRRAEVESYLEALGERGVTDASNRDPIFTRNRIRHDLLPLLRTTFNPRVDESLLRLASLAEETDALFGRLARVLLREAWLVRTSEEVSLRIGPLAGAEAILVREVIRRVLDEQSWPRGEIGHEELVSVAELVHRDPPAAIDLPKGLRAERRNRPEPLLRLRRRSTRLRLKS
ncbi:tRNA lysidine(34) synthetase TilS [Kolteria novifilia]|uniref:tRNA lysidine(34) synthetase TilS n=1 Tax=Kolteria novifilia TaxID=2527975 RepID=UPI003AF36A75